MLPDGRDANIFTRTMLEGVILKDMIMLELYNKIIKVCVAPFYKLTYLIRFLTK